MLWPTVANRWSPLAEFDRLQREMNRLFDAMLGAGGPAEYPAVNIWTNNDGAVLTAELPGVRPEDLEVSVQGDTVTIRGKREPEELKEGETWIRRERGAGSFVRSFALPFEVDPENVKATYKNGVLHLELPRAEADKPRKIEVKTE